MVHGDVRTCSRDRNTLDAVHQSARHAGKTPINQNGKGGANPGHDGKSYMTLASMRPSPGEVTLGIRGRPERAATPLAHALYILLSLPPHLPRLVVYSATAAIHRAVHRGPPPGAFRRGGQFSTRANLGHASNTKGPLRRKTCTPKTAMTPVVATIRLRRSSPRSRGPPSQSESYVWDKALICRRLGESNSSI